MSKAAIALLGLAGGLALAEIALRSWTPGVLTLTLANIERGFLVLDDADHPGWPHCRPGADARIRGVRYTCNDLGLRDDPMLREKPLDTFRFLALGDSFTFGAGVEHDETWVEQLESVLDEARPTRHVEVVNGGVDGYNSAQELWLLEHLGLGLDPDLVLLMFTDNDCDPALPRPPRRGPLRAGLFASRHVLALTHLVVLERYRMPPAQPPSLAPADWRRLEVADGSLPAHRMRGSWGLCAGGDETAAVGPLLAMERLLAARGVPLVLIGVDPGTTSLLEFGRDAGVDTLVPTGIDYRAFRLASHDDHLDARGNALLAAAIAWGLARGGWLTPIGLDPDRLGALLTARHAPSSGP